MTGPGDLRHDSTVAYKATADLQNVIDRMIGQVKQMNGVSQPVLNRGQGDTFAALRQHDGDLNTRLNALLQRLTEVKELTNKGTQELTYSDGAAAAAAHRAVVEPGTAAPLGSIGGVPVNS